VREPQIVIVVDGTPPFALDISLPTEADTFGGAGRAGFELSPGWRMQAGFDFYNLDQDARRFVSRRSNGFLIFNDVVWPDAEINDQGVYVQTSKTYERGEIAAAFRMDFVQTGAGRPSDFFLANTSGELDQTETNPNFSINGRYRLADGVSVGGGFGRVVRTANSLERFSDRFPSTKFQIAAEFLGDPAIEPEVSYQGDASLNLSYTDFSLQFGGFLRRINDYITVAADPDLPKRLPLSPPTVFRYLNGDHANFRGWYFGIRYRPIRIAELRVQGNHVLGDEISEDVPQIGLSEPILGIPPHQITSALRLFEPTGRFWAEFSALKVWDHMRVAASRFERPSPGFTVFNLRFGARLPGQFTLHLGVENLGDKNYFQHLNSPNPFTGQRVLEPGRSGYVRLSRRW